MSKPIKRLYTLFCMLSEIVPKEIINISLALTSEIIDKIKRMFKSGSTQVEMHFYFKHAMILCYKLKYHRNDISDDI